MREIIVLLLCPDLVAPGVEGDGVVSLLDHTPDVHLCFGLEEDFSILVPEYRNKGFLSLLRGGRELQHVVIAGLLAGSKHDEARMFPGSFVRAGHGYEPRGELVDLLDDAFPVEVCLRAVGALCVVYFLHVVLLKRAFSGLMYHIKIIQSR